MATPLVNTVPVSSVGASGDYRVDDLIKGVKWGDGVGTPVTLTYSFPNRYLSNSWFWSIDDYGPMDGVGEPWNYADGLITSEKSAVVSALAKWAAVANISFVNVADNLNTVGEIRVAWTSDPTPGAGQAWAYLPDSFPAAGDIWLNLDAWWDGLTPGSYGYLTLMHELGHALGLSHTFEGSGSLGGALPPDEDGYHYSIMSYSGLAGTLDSWVDFQPTTPMLYDIAAIQYLYGANLSYHAGNDTYIFVQGKQYFQTIWDAGGTDTIVWSAKSESAIIDLTPGGWSDLGNGLTFTDSMYDVVGTSDYTVAIYYTVIIENATGGSGNDELIGNAVANRLDGGLGADKLSGDDGNDTLIGGGGFGNDTLQGGAGNDSLQGSAGMDVLDAGVGNDTLDGGTESDVLVVLGNFADYTRSRTSLTETRLLNALTGENISIRNIESVIFLDGTRTLNQVHANIVTPFNDAIEGGAGNDLLNGLAGADTLVGLAGDDSYVVEVPGDVIVEAANAGTDVVNVLFAAAGTYTLSANVEHAQVGNATTSVNLTGNASNNALQGNAGANILTGGAGNDTLNGGAGGDRMLGGLGDDDYIINVLADAITERVSEGSDQVSVQLAVAGTYVLVANLESASIGNATAGVNLTGNALGNILIGNDAANILNGGAGVDTLIGGGGNDTYVIDSAGDVVTEVDGEGSADLANVAIATGMTYTLVDHLENATVTSTALINLTGNILDNVLTGNAAVNTLNGGNGDDVLDGKAGLDIFFGGAGDDTYIIDRKAEQANITENVAEGTDTLKITYATSVAETVSLTGILANIENITVLGTGLFNLTGNGSNNILIGNASANILDGGLGDDILSGGAGNDVYVIKITDDIVVEAAAGGTDRIETDLNSYTLGTEVENLTYTGSADFTGTGQELKNSIIGGIGNDSLYGLAGNDTLSGGVGSDTLIGGVGVDSLIGGVGDDTYIVNLLRNASSGLAVLEDVVTEAAGQGIDTLVLETTLNATLNSARTTLTLAATLDNLDASATGSSLLNLTGNALANILTGNGAANVLSGGLGLDTLIGGDGNDTLIGGAENDLLTGGAGADLFVLNSLLGTDTLKDFTDGTDGFALSKAVFTKLTGFAVGSVHNLADLSSNFAYSSVSGALTYDADGAGGTDAVTLAIIGQTTHPDTLASGFTILA